MGIFKVMAHFTAKLKLLFEVSFIRGLEQTSHPEQYLSLQVIATYNNYNIVQEMKRKFYPHVPPEYFDVY